MDKYPQEDTFLVHVVYGLTDVVDKGNFRSGFTVTASDCRQNIILMDADLSSADARAACLRAAMYEYALLLSVGPKTDFDEIVTFVDNWDIISEEGNGHGWTWIVRVYFVMRW